MGLLGVVYNLSIGASQKLYGKIKWEPLRLLIPFLCAGALGFTLPEVLGGGHPLAHKIAEGKFALWMLCLLFTVKFVFSMVSFGSGAPGGIFLPLLVMGSMIGSIYYGGAGALHLAPDGLLGNFLILAWPDIFPPSCGPLSPVSSSSAR